MSFVALMIIAVLDSQDAGASFRGLGGGYTRYDRDDSVIETVEFVKIVDVTQPITGPYDEVQLYRGYWEASRSKGDLSQVQTANSETCPQILPILAELNQMEGWRFNVGGVGSPVTWRPPRVMVARLVRVWGQAIDPTGLSQRMSLESHDSNLNDWAASASAQLQPCWERSADQP